MDLPDYIAQAFQQPQPVHSYFCSEISHEIWLNAVKPVEEQWNEKNRSLSTS